MYKKFLQLCSFIILQTGNSFPQFVEEWVARYSASGSFDDNAVALEINNAGNVFVTGYSYIPGPRHDYTTIKYDSNGDTVWVRRYNGPGNNSDFAQAMAVDISGNVYVTGESVGAGPGEDFATVKYNTTGEQQWAARYNGPGNYWDRANAIVVDLAGNVYVTGESWGPGYDYATIKYNSNGDTVWVRRYDGGYGGDYPQDIAIDDSGNVYVTGHSDGQGTFTDFATIKYDASGNIKWIKRYNNTTYNGPDFAISVAIDDTGNVYVTGHCRGLSYEDDITTIKYSSAGEELWVSSYDGPENYYDLADEIILDNNGNIYVTGCSLSSVGGRDIITIKYNVNGDTLWVRRYNGPGNGEDYGRSVALDSAGNIYVTGESYDLNSDNDYVILKYSANGALQMLIRYNGPANNEDNSNSIAVDNYGNVYVTGGSIGVGTDVDYATIKYSQIVGVESASNEIPNQFILYQNYPNPFNPSTVISYQLPVSGNVKIKVYDILGNEVVTLVNEYKSAGSYEVEFDASKVSSFRLVRNLPSGVYFYQLRAGSFVQTKKMILLR